MGLFSYLANGENRRNLKHLNKLADQVLALENKYSAMTEEELKGQTDVLKARLAEIEKAVECGVKFILNSDAHSPGKVGDISVPQSVVERLHIPADRIANYDSAPQLRSAKK